MIHRQEAVIGGRVMSIETGRVAEQANGAVLVRYGDTVLLATAVGSNEPREGIDFFPLTVDVEERMYAAGKIPGSFFRREGRPGEQAILTCRLTDRPLRPSFPDDFRNEVQVIATILGADQENPHDIASINGASAALMVSGIPFDGPIGAVRLAHLDGAWAAFVVGLFISADSRRCGNFRRPIRTTCPGFQRLGPLSP